MCCHWQAQLEQRRALLDDRHAASRAMLQIEALLFASSPTVSQSVFIMQNFGEVTAPLKFAPFPSTVSLEMKAMHLPVPVHGP